MLVVVCLLPVLSACGSAANDEPSLRAVDRIEYHTVFQGVRPGTGHGERNVARLSCDAVEARGLLRRWGLDAAGHLGAVDFGRSCVIVVLAAARPSTGYRVRVLRVVASGGHAVLDAVVFRPAGIVDGAAISRPYALLAVDRSATAGLGSVVRVRLRR